MFNVKTTTVAAMFLVAGLPATAQSPKISGLAQLWYTQMTDSNLRQNTPTGPYNLRNEFRENGFSIRRTEVKLSGSLGDLAGEFFKNIEYDMMIDPSINNNGNDKNTTLQDLSIKYKLPNNFEVRVGQFKPLQTLEGMTSSSELLFAERSMLGRVFGDIRDRGIAGSVGFGDTNAFNGRVHLGLFNGNGKANDSNAQNDVIARLDMHYGKKHYFGFYTLQGSTDLADKGGLFGGSFGADIGPGREDVMDNKDRTTNLGGFYRFQDEKFHASFEFITGLLGRRYPSLVTSDTGNVHSYRKHLDQSFLGYVGTFSYTSGKHSLVARYDFMNYNSGNDWYTASSPYKNSENKTDYTPQYTEITLGYIYAFMPGKMKNANIKLNYVMRSKNFMQPLGTQVGEQGGDSIVAVFQIGF